MDPQVIAGRYEVVRPIGSGGMGTVWLCRDTVLGREVAVKRIGALPGEPAAAARAMREARIAASLNDPHAVGVFDVVDESDAHWLVMEYVEGQSLAEKIRDLGTLPPERVAAIGSSIAGALARAHDRGIVHRDVKPGNILIDNAGTPKVSDFGIARAQADDQLTQTGFMTGTPGYLSPELARGGNPTPASDVWALGATLYYAVEGQPPYEPHPNPLATLQAIANGEARPMRHAGPLGGAIAAMMDQDPARRWDMATAKERLDRIARGDQTLALPAGAVLGSAAATEVIPEPVETASRVEKPPPLLPFGDPPDDRDDVRDDVRDDERRGGRGWVAALAVLLLLAGVAAAYVLTDGFGGTDTPTARGTTTTVTSTQTQTPSTSPTTSRTSPSTTTTRPTTTTTTTQAQRGDDASLARFIEQYFRDVTKENRRDDTFARLTPKMQQAAGGRGGYEGFWSTIQGVEVSDVRADAEEGRVVVTLTYKLRDGEDSEETKRYTVVPDGDDWLIDTESDA